VGSNIVSQVNLFLNKDCLPRVYFHIVMQTDPVPSKIFFSCDQLLELLLIGFCAIYIFLHTSTLESLGQEILEEQGHFDIENQ
jgi:hypothetical protein